jgi:hypothetical protein
MTKVKHISSTSEVLSNSTIKNKESLITSSIDDIYDLFSSSMDQVLAEIKNTS